MKKFEPGHEKGKIKRKKGSNSNLKKVQRYVASLNKEQISRMISDAGKPSIDSGNDVTAAGIYKKSKAGNAFIQPKLEISQPADRSEQQADQVAEGVMKGDTHLSKAALDKSSADIHTKSDGSGMSTTPAFDQQLQGTKGQGQKLDNIVKSEMESHLGTDLSNVNVHTGGAAKNMSEGINAKAFTHGQDVYFNEGQYNPASDAGKSLLAHELTHTVQQASDVKRKIQRAAQYKVEKHLQSIWFRNVPELENAFDGTLAFGIGAAGVYVQRIQLALLKLGQVMRWTDATGKKFLVNLGPGGDDGKFGKHTFLSLKGVQAKLGLKADGIVGKNTMEKLDSLFWKEKKLPESYNQLKAEQEIQQAIPKTEYYSSGRMGATMSTYKDISTTGKKVYDQPSGKEVFRIKYGEELFINSYSDDWYAILYKGKTGWVQKDFVKDPFPKDDEDADLYFVQPGDQLSKIVQQHYKSINEDSKDARLLAYSVAKANVGRTGVTINMQKGEDSLNWFDKITLDDNGEKAQAIWRTIQVKSGTNIWLPSNGRVYELKRQGVISSGSKTEALMEDLEVVGYYIMGFFEGIWQSISDLFTGLYDLGKLAYKTVELFSSPVKLTEMWTYIQQLKWEEVKNAIIAIPGALWNYFEGNWNDPVRTKAAEFRGEVIGYIVAEIILAIFTAGIFTEVKWVSFVLSKLGKVGEILLEIINAARKVLSKEARAEKYAEELLRLEKLRKAEEAAKLAKAGIKFSFKDLMSKYERHIFSKDHIGKGIMDLGKNKQDIINKIEKIILKNVDNLKAGDNFILQKINGQESTIKMFIKNGEVISIDAYKGYPTRMFGNIIR